MKSGRYKPNCKPIISFGYYLLSIHNWEIRMNEETHYMRTLKSQETQNRCCGKREHLNIKY